MLEALKFVQRGVARRDIVPGLTHFRIKDGRVTGYNGSYSLSAPVDIGFNVAPMAGFFVKALNSCEDVIQLRMDGPTKLHVQSGDFETCVPCIPLDSVPETKPEGVTVDPHGEMLGALEALKPFVGRDASRPWATGVLLSGQSAFATNNIIVAEYWLGTAFPHVVNVPSLVIDEVIRVSEELTTLQIAGGSITFHYADGRWIKSSLLALDWPNAMAVLDHAWQGAQLTGIPQGLAEACEKLAKFGDQKDSRTYFRGEDVATHREGVPEGGGRVRLQGVPPAGCYHTEFLNDLFDVAEAADFGRYPNPIPFTGARVRGAMVGIVE